MPVTEVEPEVSAPPPPPVAMTFAPGVEQWRDVLEQQRSGEPLHFLMQWLARESGGRPCAVGFRGAQDPVDKLFKFEAGIGQQFFEAKTRAELDNTMVNGVPLRILRAACEGNTERQLRPLTDEEKVANVQAFLGDVRKFRARAHAQLAHAGIDWPESSDDFWMLVKLQHALPCVASSFLTPAAHTGQAGSYKQFKAFVNNLDHATYTALTTASGCGPAMARFYGHGTANALDNAEIVGRGSWA